MELQPDTNAPLATPASITGEWPGQAVTSKPADEVPEQPGLMVSAQLPFPISNSMPGESLETPLVMVQSGADCVPEPLSEQAETVRSTYNEVTGAAWLVVAPAISVMMTQAIAATVRRNETCAHDSVPRASFGQRGVPIPMTGGRFITPGSASTKVCGPCCVEKRTNGWVDGWTRGVAQSTRRVQRPLR